MTKLYCIAAIITLAVPSLAYPNEIVSRTTTIGKAQSLSMSQIQQNLLAPAPNKTSVISDLNIQTDTGSAITLSSQTDQQANQLNPTYQVTSHPEHVVFTYRLNQPQATEISVGYNRSLKTVTQMSVTTAGRTYQCNMSCAAGGSFEYDLTTGRSVLTIIGGLLFHRDASRTETAIRLNGTLRGLTEQPFLSYLSLPSTTVSNLKINQQDVLNLTSTASSNGLSAWITTQNGQKISVFKDAATQKIYSSLSIQNSADTFMSWASYTPNQITIDSTSHPFKTIVRFNQVKYGYPATSDGTPEHTEHQINGTITIYKPLRFINISDWRVGQQQRIRSISNARIALTNHNQMTLTGASITATVINNQLQAVSYIPTSDRTFKYACHSVVECAGGSPYLSNYGYGVHFNNMQLKLVPSSNKPTNAKPVVYLHGYLHSMGR